MERFMMSERFADAPAWAKKWLFWISVTVYAILSLMGLVAMTWPREDMHLWEWITARGAGITVVIAALICLASYPAHRWRWELHAVWILGTGLAAYVLVVLSYAPLADRGLLVGSLTALVLLIYARGISAIIFGYKTTGTALRFRRNLARG
jgi:hypothetical protein